MSDISKLAREVLDDEATIDVEEWGDIAKTLARAVLEMAEREKRLREALEAVKPFYYVTGDDGIPKRYCWWCHVVADVSGEYTHAPDCLYQRALTSKQP